MFWLNFKTDNAAFDDYGRGETARILRVLADRIDTGSAALGPGVIRDGNGNQIGTYTLTEEA